MQRPGAVARFHPVRASRGWGGRRRAKQHALRRHPLPDGVFLATWTQASEPHGQVGFHRMGDGRFLPGRVGRTSCWLEASPGNHPRPGPQMEAGMVLRLSLRAPAIFSRSFLLRQALKEPSASGFTMRHPLRTCRALFQRTLEPCRTQRPGFVPYPRKTGRLGICAHHCNFKKSSASHTVPTMESCRYRALRKRSDFVRFALVPAPCDPVCFSCFFQSSAFHSGQALNPVDAKHGEWCRFNEPALMPGAMKKIDLPDAS